jgi:hypothetical protein
VHADADVIALARLIQVRVGAAVTAAWLQFVMPSGLRSYPVETIRFPKTTTAPTSRLSQLAFCLTASAIRV